MTQTAHNRVAGAFVLVIMAIACLAFWLLIPFAVLWGMGELAESGTAHFLGALIGVPAAMVATAPLLVWLNGLYLRVTGVLERLDEDEDEAGWQRRLRGPLEPMLVACFVVELVALFVWFFFFAENPSISVI